MELLQESNCYTQRANGDQLSRCQEVDVSGPLLERDIFSLILVSHHEIFAFGWSLLGNSTARENSRGFATPRSVRNEHRNSILMTRDHPDLGSASFVGPGGKFCFNQSEALTRWTSSI